MDGNAVIAASARMNTSGSALARAGPSSVLFTGGGDGGAGALTAGAGAARAFDFFLLRPAVLVGMVSTVLTLGEVPLILCDPGHGAEQ